MIVALFVTTFVLLLSHLPVTYRHTGKGKGLAVSCPIKRHKLDGDWKSNGQYIKQGKNESKNSFLGHLTFYIKLFTT